MAKKQSKLGFDPLSWMQEEETEKSAPAPKKTRKAATKKPATRKKAASTRKVRNVKAASKAKDEHPLGLDVELLESSFNALAPQAEALVSRFYEELFSRYPQVKPLFRNTTPESQKKKLIAALVLVVENLRKPDVLAKALTEMGARHQGYGAVAEHYAAVRDTLLDVMKELAGDLWTREVEIAWTDALNVIAEAMLGGYTEAEEADMPISAVSNGAASDEFMDNLEVLKDIMENAPINIMIADADENVVYVNKRARDVLGEVESELATYIPGFDANSVVGGSIHRYHKDPQAIKNILHGLRPGQVREGEIATGPFVFEHETRVLTDRAGNTLGYVVQWHDATERRQKEEEAFRLQRAIDSAQTAMMMIDRDLIITYANESTIQLLREHEADLRALYPGFKADDVIGTCIDIFHKNPAHQRQLLDNPANLPYETDIQVGPLMFHIRVGAMRDLDGNYIGCTLEWADVTEVRIKEREVARLQSAVDGAQANLMLCDEDLNITYVNPAVIKMLARRQDVLRQHFPGFDVNNLVGTNIDVFHKNPAHQRALLSDVSRLPATAEIQVADLHFQVNATAVLDQDGNYMGNMVQWVDITEQKNAESQIERLIESAVRGDLDQRIDAETFDGFMKQLSAGINSLLDAIVEPVRESKRVLSSLAEGDLTQNMNGEFQGEFAEMRDAINTSMGNLLNIVNEIRNASTSITAGASEISKGNQDLSQRTEEQASSLEETASSMEEMTSTVKQNADNARQANQLASAASAQAEKGGEVVQNAVTAMAEINDSSKKIADIISVIDEIAFQTNLLALNAAVEAARAGEQGRGFAVVAGEVRNLAQRSAGAAKEIKTLIKDSVDKVEEGSKLVYDSGQTLDEIVQAVKKVSDIIAEIAAASQEQSSGIEQVNKAVMQMDEMTQQNAALVEEAASASESMEEQAKGLLRLMDYFNIGEQLDQPTSMVAPAQAPTQPAARPTPVPSPAGAAARPAATPKPRPRPQTQDDGDWEEF
ncbi:MAG TPA: PAS domain-containing protein [Gammaproteobacteria bacterium]|nr:PAS domain-containing protein [Gammaproteobacteria bacterium]